jgi:hypothetical protein
VGVVLFRPLGLDWMGVVGLVGVSGAVGTVIGVKMKREDRKNAKSQARRISKKRRVAKRVSSDPQACRSRQSTENLP